MKKIGLLVLLITLIIALSACRRVEEYTVSDTRLEPVMIDDNYRVYYEIFLGGFSDSSGDGMGDLQGLIQRLDYLNDGDPSSGRSLGITGIWLMPIMPSPSYHKYDTTDYKAIDTAYGTLDDFRQLIREANDRGIDIIIDLVINHTSSYHPWFRTAREAMRNGDLDHPYLEYYNLVKEEEKVPGRTYYPFHGEYYYEGNFWSEMPELNVTSELVRQEIVDIITFWLDLGVKGFRLDAVKYPFFGEVRPNIDFWHWFMDEVRAIRADAYVVGEMWDSDANIILYYEAMNNFDFGMSGASGAVAMTANGIEPVSSFVNYLTSYRNRVKEVNPKAILQPFISNHDMNRAAGYLSVEDGRMQMAANLYILSYGTPFIYYGEEIGMRGSRGTENTDANRRLAMLWGDRDSVKDPIGSTFPASSQVNGTVQDQIGDPNSLYTHYKKLIMVRHANPEIARGEYQPIDFPGYFHFGGFLSTYENSTVAVFHNTGNQTLTIDLSDFTEITFSQLRAYIGQGSARLEGQTLIIEALTSVVLK